MSALNLIVFGQKLEHLDLIEYVIVDLLKVKWNSFVKRTFYTQFAIFVAFFILSTGCFVNRETTPKTKNTANCTLSSNLTDTENIVNVTMGLAATTVSSIVNSIKSEDYLQVLVLTRIFRSDSISRSRYESN